MATIETRSALIPGLVSAPTAPARGLPPLRPPVRGRAFSLTGHVLYGLVSTSAFVAEIVLLMYFFRSGQVGTAFLLIFIGTPIMLPLVHVIGLMVAAPFSREAVRDR